MESLRSILFAFSTVLLWPLVARLVLVQVDAQSRVEEVAALTSFRKALAVTDASNAGSPYWFTWKEDDENACGWVGVTCTSNYTVEALDFSGWGLFTLSNFTSLSELPDLRQLDMSSVLDSLYKDPQGIPDDIGTLTQLSRLDLSNNGLGGSIPSSISACRGLRFLSLENNYISGAIPDLSDLVHLQFLLLADNVLTGPFPSEVGEISSLVIVDISRNQLNGSIPSFLNSTNLRTLLLDSNSFTEFEEPMHINATNLQELSIADNLLHGTIPLALRDLAYLFNLNMSFNHLSGTIPSGLYHETVFDNEATTFFSVDLSHNQLSGSVPEDLLQHPFNYFDRSYIALSYNLLNGSILPTTQSNRQGYITAQLFVDLSHNQLRGAIPVSLAISATWLSLENNLLSGDIVDLLSMTPNNTNSYSWSLGNNYFTGDLSRIGFQSITWPPNLVTLDLSNNNLSCTASESIPDPINAILYNLATPHMLGIYLGGNNFSGASLPVAPIFKGQKYGFEYLNSLDLSNCQLEGNISANVFNNIEMSQLQSLNLSHNLVSGPVLENITNITSLMILDLSYNNLSGPLPAVSQNSFLLNTTFFLGNKGLCGYPLDPCPQVFSRHPTGEQWWTLVIIICGSLMTIVGSCLIVTWRWRVYSKLHEQDADLIQTLMDRELVTLMPLRNLKKATNNFDESAQIGEGGFGTVFMGQLNDGTQVAIKRSKREGSEKDKEQFLNEVRILSQVNHRHLVKLLGCCMENKVALLVFEFISNGTLEDHLCGKVGDGHLSWKQRLDIAVQTADALNYLHSSTTFPIYHRDVKSANILLNDDCSAKVADFGISKLAPTRATHISTALQGTIGYIDPEYWVSFQLSDKSDVYSFGVVLLELISAKSPIDFQRGEEETSLAIFASSRIQSENLESFIDPTLMRTYGEKSGHGKKSVLDVGRLAMRCVHLQSRARPSMNEVWKELQDLSCKLDGTLMEEDLGSLNNHDSGNLTHDLGLANLPLCSINRSDSLKQVDHDSLKQVDHGSLELANFSNRSSCI